LLEAQDIQLIAPSFSKRYLAEQDMGNRVATLAYSDKEFTEYVTIKWQSDYPPFAEQGIPEIQNLKILPTFQR